MLLLQGGNIQSDESTKRITDDMSFSRADVPQQANNIGSQCWTV